MFANSPLPSATPAAGSWITSAGAHAADGSVIQGNGIGYCIPARDGEGGGPCSDFGVGADNQWTYQPGDLFWPLQWLELGIFVVLSGRCCTPRYTGCAAASPRLRRNQYSAVRFVSPSAAGSRTLRANCPMSSTIRSTW